MAVLKCDRADREPNYGPHRGSRDQSRAVNEMNREIEAGSASAAGAEVIKD